MCTCAHCGFTEERERANARTRLRLQRLLAEELPFTAEERGIGSQVPPPMGGVPETLPEPLFPQQPELIETPHGYFFPEDGKRHWTAPQIRQDMQGMHYCHEKSHGRTQTQEA